MTEKLKLNGAEFDIESVRAALKEYDEAKKKESELFHGYNMKQWERIIVERHPDGTKKYLCEFINNKHEVRGFVVGSLKAIHKHWDGDVDGSFIISSDHDMTNDCFQHCRPAQRYGVLIPHFGGEKPEWLANDDLIVYKRYDDGTVTCCRVNACYIGWHHVTEFIAMPAEA